MAAITASMVAELRGKTDAPMMECKKALTEADGDMAKAEELLRVKLGTKAGKAASRITAEGVVASFIDGDVGALIEVNCETDFVTKNDSFLALANAAAEAGGQAQPRRRRRAGRAAYSQDGFGPTLEDVRKGLIGKIGENMSSAASSALPGRQSWPPTCTARASAWWSSSTATNRRQGRGHARGRHEARGPDQRRRACRADRKRAFGGCCQGRRCRKATAGKPVQSPKSLPSASKAACRSTSRKSRCSTSLS
jgi:hypothetical protein